VESAALADERMTPHWKATRLCLR